ncbi:MAG: T9SS type A sorting domain-containing protein [Pedobacter sp.]|uniref:T9SS type A sorting domain-containing protein n=1 Tax=Pedobacter sp. TaxID=1411316 RepID=UPI00280899FD|nr:T9SS type A sorting domain-containing protein [Pedobacter sp.]MDQ8005602.1 T9SS type A sorting domain-containing protein [Pedobacter sp.]
MRKTLLKALPMLFVGLLFALQTFSFRRRWGVLMVLLFVVSAARGQIYVSVTGNDGNDGKSLASAKATLASAIVAVGSETVPYIKLGAGTFVTVGVAVPQGVRVVGAGAAQTTLEVTSNSIALQNGSSLSNVTVTRTAPSSEGGGPSISVSTYSGSNNITVKNVRFVGNRTGIYLQGSNHVIVDNEFENNRTGLVIDPSGSPVAGLVLERNRFYRNRSYAAIFLGPSDNASMTENVSARIAYNDFIGNLAGGIELNASTSADKVVFIGNHFDQTNNAILAQRTNGDFTVNDHNVVTVYPYNFTDNNVAADYPNAVSGANTAGVTVVGTLNAATPNANTYGNPFVSSNSPSYSSYVFIQDAINYSNAGAVVDIGPGNYTLTSGVTINKSITLLGNGGTLSNKPLITGGDIVNKALIYVESPNVTISNLHLRFEESSFSAATTTTTAGYGIKSGPTGSFNNLAITDNLIEGTNTAYVFNSAAIFLGVLNTNGSDNVSILRNTVGHTVSNNSFGRAIRVFNINGNIEANDLKGHYASIQAGDPSGGALIVNNNTMQGKLAMNGYVSAGNKITNNIITSGGTADANGATGADRQPALIEVISTTVPAATVEVSGNTLNDFKMLGIAVFYSSNVSVINNTLNPLKNSSNTVGLYFDTKTTNSGTPGAKSFSNLIVKQNTFNAPLKDVGVTLAGNVGVKFANSYADASLTPLTGAVIGGVGVDANIFDAALDEYIHLDNRAAANTTGDDIWGSPYYNSAAVTNILPFSANVIAEMNVYGSIDTRTDRTQASFNTIKGKINDKDDAVALGEVFLNLPIRNVTTGVGYATIQSAVDAATAGDEISVDAGTYAEKIVVNKRLTIKGPNVGVVGTGTRQAEAKIVPNVVDLSGTSASLVQFTAGSDGSIFDGFEVNGNNTALTSGTVGGGEDIDAPFGVRIKDAGKITIQNNVVKNLYSTQPTPFPYAYGIYSSPPTSSASAYSEIVVKNNYVGNIQTSASAAFTGILMVDNYYAQITGNKVEDVRTAVQMNNFFVANPTPAFEASVSDNEIIASRGVYYNLFYGTASPWKINGNNISSASIANGSAANFTGIRVETLQAAFAGGGEISDNIIDGKSAARTAENAGFDGTGLWFQNEITTPGVILVKNNTIGFVNNGILYNAVDGVNLTNNVKYLGGNIHDVVNNYVKYTATGTPNFSNIDLATTQLDGKTGGQYTSAELATIYSTKIIDKDDNSVFGKVTLFFNVKNLTQGTSFATIQAAIDDAATQNGDVVDVSNGTLNLTTAVNVNKSITLQGNFNTLSAKPIITGTGNVTNKALFEVNAPNVTISNFEFQIAQTGNAMIGVSTTTTDNFNNLTIADNIFKGVNPGNTGMIWASHGIKLGRGSAGVSGGVPNNLINVMRNVITYDDLGSPELFGRGIYAFNTYGKIGGSDADKNTITAAYALQGGELGGGVGNNFEFSHNEVPIGLVSVVGAEAGSHKISANKIGYGVPNVTVADGIMRMLEVKGSRTSNANIEVSDNIITQFSKIGVFVQRSNNVTIKGNTLTPISGAGAFNSIVFSSKEGTGGSQNAATSENLTIISNELNGTGGVGITFLNHNGDASLKPLINAKIGGSDTDKNTFAATLGTYIALDATPFGTKTLGATMDRLYDIIQKDTDPDPSKNNATNIFPFNGDIDASYNVFGTINTGTETDFDNLLSVKGSIADGMDDPLTGYVNIQPQKAFIGATAVFANALTVVPENFTLVLKNDDAVYHNLGDRTISKAFTFDIDNNTTAEIIFGNLIVNALGKQVTFTDKAKANGDFTLTEGKINAPLGFTLDASKAISFNTSKPSNYVNGTVTLRSVSAGASETILIGNATTSTAVALTDPAGATASDFEITYTGSVHPNAANFNSANIGLVSNKEFWTVNKVGGDIQTKVGLTTFDFTNSGFTSFAPADAVVARYDGANWVSAGNTDDNVNGAVGVMTSASTSDFGAFTFAKTPLAVLPISLISFSAQATNGGALVKWSTANEENNAKFEVEKSLDGKNFFVIDTKDGKGNSITISNYEFLDATFKQSAYYRLVDVSASGKRNPHTSLTKFVKGLDNSLSVVAYPNPVTTKLFVSVGSANKENVKVSLVDLTGKTLKTKTADSSQPIELDVAGVATGSYILQVIKDSGNVSKKIVKL